MIPVSAGIVAFGAIDEPRSDPTGSRDKTARAELRKRSQMTDLSAVEPAVIKRPDLTEECQEFRVRTRASGLVLESASGLPRPVPVGTDAIAETDRPIGRRSRTGSSRRRRHRRPAFRFQACGRCRKGYPRPERCRRNSCRRRVQRGVVPAVKHGARQHVFERPKLQFRLACTMAEWNGGERPDPQHDIR